MADVNRPVQVRFTYSLGDHTALMSSVRCGVWLRLPALCLYLVSAAIGLAVPYLVPGFRELVGQLDNEAVNIVAYIGVPVLVYFILNRIILRRIRVSSFNACDIANRNLSISIDGEDILLESDIYSYRRKISSFFNLSTKKNHLVILFSRIGGLAIPKSAFQTVEDFELFLKQLQQMHGAEQNI